jgi:hypothetical protein
VSARGRIGTGQGRAAADAAAPPVDQLLDCFGDRGRVLTTAAPLQQPRFQQRIDVVVAQIDGDEEAHRLWSAVGDRLPAGGICIHCRPMGRRPVRLVLFENPLEPVGGAAQGLQANERCLARRVGVVQGLVQPAHLALHQRELGAQSCQHLGLQARRVLRAPRVLAIAAVAPVSLAVHHSSPLSVGERAAARHGAVNFFAARAAPTGAVSPTFLTEWLTASPFPAKSL